MAQNNSQNSRRQTVFTGETVPQEHYQKLKRRAQEMQSENDRVNAELERALKRIKTLKREKELIICRLNQYEEKDFSESEKSVKAESIEFEELSSLPNSRASSLSSLHNLKKKTSRPRISDPNKMLPHIPANNMVNTMPIMDIIPTKRVTKTPLNSKTLKVQYVEKDKHENYILPVQIGSILTVISLGKIIYDRDTFHNDRYIWPVGYEVRRSYNSMINPDSLTMYTCKIEDGGDGPRFVIEADDQPDEPITAKTATGAWTNIVRTANAIRHRNHSNAASGPDYFGFSQATIRKMIQDLPNASKCKNYVMQNFEVMKTRNGDRKRRANGLSTENGKASSSAAPEQSPTKENDENEEKGTSSDNDNDNEPDDVIMSDANGAESSED
ncbi:hypothetical protein G9A89_014484 [Geosiphon pyriformis]|nr:hypothetical protein G9A89_014484 [Geosiphon pyriformis]